MHWLSLGMRKMREKCQRQGYHGVSLEMQWELMNSFNLEGVRVAREVYEEEWESESEDLDYQDDDIAYEDDHDEEAILNCTTFAD